jgi:hypothetical protein
MIPAPTGKTAGKQDAKNNKSGKACKSKIRQQDSFACKIDRELAGRLIQALEIAND